VLLVFVSEQGERGLWTELTAAYCVKGNSIIMQIPGPAEAPVGPQREAWIKTVPLEVIDSLPESEINRQT
jgi:hypothetical protein